MIEKPTSAPYARRLRAAIVSGAFVLALSIMGIILFTNEAQPGASAKTLQGASSLPMGGQWQILPPVTNENLRKVSMTSSTDGWAVGDNGILLHYDGAAWHVVNLNTTDTLVDVYMLNSTNGYIVAWSDNGSDIFHYNGASWVLEYPTTATLNSVHASSAHNVWVVGLNTSVHWDGAQWTVVPIPVDRTLFNVRVVSDNEAWAFGNFEPVSGHGLILHNTNGSWVQSQSSAPQTIFEASFTSPDDVWGVGTFVTTTHVNHYDGTQWTWVYTNSLGLFHLDMLSPTDGWATGQSQSGPTIAHLYSGTFVTVTDPLNRVFVNGIDMLSPYEGWIVGQEGATLYYTCPLSFTDVQPGDYFYEPVHYLTCAGIISGYSDNTFRPGDTTAREQLTKIIVLAKAWPLVCPQTPTFTDVPPGDPYYCFVETAAAHHIVSAYGDGSFRPNNNVTRGQLSKITVLAEGWPIDISGGPHFTDVAPGDPFYPYVETAYNRRIVSGYADGTFRPVNNATRGQISKITYNAMSILTLP